jgi:nucleotidyltransferase/DNA polymerase involved in DNA repair
MRPLTEYFHSKSVEVQEDYQLHLETSNSRSVNNLTTHPSSDDEDLHLETYTNSLRRSARNILARQVAEQARIRSSARKSASVSSENLLCDQLPLQSQMVQAVFKFHN